jgi:hypoxanthine phosphoribosyltransferase
VLIPAAQIQQRIAQLGAQISRDYAGRRLMFLSVLRGSFIFAADLARAIQGDLCVEFLGVRSYGNSTRSSGEVEITHDSSVPVTGTDVLVVEDIVDTGLTAAYILRQLQSRNPSSVRLCALLDKPSRRKTEVPVDYTGFTIEDVFVVGYGLDFAQRYRNLPDVCVIEGA